jgi:hypothetical protein
MNLQEKVVKELGYSMSMPNESDIAFVALWVSRRADGSLNSTMCHIEEETLTNELREKIALVLRNLADTVCPTPHAADGAKAGGFCECSTPDFAPFIECQNCGKPPRS